ncbi:MAG: SHOCT domain-containing protein [Pseudomonadota bacterium]
MFYDGGYMVGMHGLWWIFWSVLIGVLLYIVWTRPSPRRRGPRETPHEVLRRRLANGEIDAEEYVKRKTLLDRDSAAPG